METLTKSVAELKVAISDLFAKNDLAAVDVRTGTNRKFGYVDFESAEDLEKSLDLTGLKVFGNDIELEKTKGRDSKKVKAARTFLAKNLSFNITEDELKEVCEDAMENRLLSQDGQSERTVCIEFKAEANVEKSWKKIGGQKLKDDLFHSTTLERKDKGKKELQRIALRVVNQRLLF